MNLMKIYDRLPLGLQNLACTMEGVRVKYKKYGPATQKKFDKFMERNNWSYAQKCEYRDQQLQKMVEHCYKHVPYYHELFDSLGIDYRSIKKLEDLSVLPLLTKQIVNDNRDKFLADNVPQSQLMPMHTSGTTGSSFKFYYTKDAYAAQWADKKRHDFNLGLTGKEWAAYFGGRAIVPKNSNKPPFYRVNYGMREVLFSVYHLKKENFPNYIKGLESRQLEIWHGYPSSLIQIAQYMLDHNVRLSYVPKAILLSSENVTESELDKMEQAFGIRPLQGYALTEQVATFRQYRDYMMFVIEDLSAVEFIPTATVGLYKVIGTTLTNYAMPFLRYDTKDLVTYRETEDGRQILSIDGREEDYIKLENGDTLRGSVSFIFTDQPNIVEAQVVQLSLSLVEIRVVRGRNFDKEDEKRLQKAIKDCFAEKIAYTIKYVDDIPKTKNGKMKLIVSEF